jgi:hypothetical protein
MPALFWLLELHEEGTRTYLCMKDRLVYFCDQRHDALRLFRQEDAENLAGVLSKSDRRFKRAVPTAHLCELP